MDTTSDKQLNLTLVVAPDEDDDNYRDEQTRLLRDLIEDQIDEVDAQLAKGSDLPENIRCRSSKLIRSGNQWLRLHSDFWYRCQLELEVLKTARHTPTPWHVSWSSSSPLPSAS